MKLNSLTPNLMVENVNNTVNFYNTVLGFSLLRTVPEKESFDWAMVKRDEVILMFQSKKSLGTEISQLKNQSIGGGLTLYIKVDKIGEFYNQIEEQVEIVSPLESTFYGTHEFSILDINGYVLTFSEEEGA